MRAINNKTIHTIEGKPTEITWVRTYTEPVHVNDAHNWEEELEGVDEKGNKFSGIGEIVDGEIYAVELDTL
jgi:hypothetical protein